MAKRTDNQETAAPDLKWYEFTEIATFKRGFYVQATSLEEARSKVREDKTGSTCGVPDYTPNFPDDIRIVGRGRVASDQQNAQDLFDQRARP
jgi:hypothetical protein